MGAIGDWGVTPDPFPHHVGGGFHAEAEMLALDRWVPPPPEWDGWEVVYRDGCQAGKRTTRRIDRLPLAVRRVFAGLLSPAAADGFGLAFRIDGLVPDETLHGGGLHVMPPGSKLVGHLDYARHPHRPDMERRLSVIVFLNTEWREEWGGAYCLLDPRGQVLKRVHPAPSRVLTFAATDRSYHAVEPVTGPHERVTAAVYFLTPARPDATRERALFFPDRG